MQDKTNANKILNTLSKRYEKRDGGYTRIVKAGYRYGDNSPMAVIEFVDRDVELYSEGVIKGEITFIEKGNGGFGYDSVFQPYSKIVTFAELSEKEKNKISHRAIAAEKMKEILESYLKKETI